MGSEQAREVLAQAYAHFEMHDTAKALVSVDSLNLHQEAAIRAITTAREQALREVINEVHMIMVATDVENATSEWFEALDHVADRLNSLLTKESKA